MNYTKIRENHPKIDVDFVLDDGKFRKETRVSSQPEKEVLIETQLLLPHFQFEL